MKGATIAPSEDETLDILSNRLKILQRKKGHRATSDDVLLAWAIANAAQPTDQLLDLGTGKGTVAMLALSVCPNLTAVGVEAFAESAALAQRNIILNELESRFEVLRGDLRDPTIFTGVGPFQVISGAPPFMPLGSGILPSDAQRAAGRFELRGGVEAYYETAARNITSDGTVIVLMDGGGAERNERAAAQHGLFVEERIDIAPRPGAFPTYSLCVSRPFEVEFRHARVTMRGLEGSSWSPWYQSVRERLDLPT
ncbi:MAG: methyltransferase [Bradymonadia bacterium]